MRVVLIGLVWPWLSPGAVRAHTYHHAHFPHRHALAHAVTGLIESIPPCNTPGRSTSAKQRAVQGPFNLHEYITLYINQKKKKKI